MDHLSYFLEKTLSNIPVSRERIDTNERKRGKNVLTERKNIYIYIFNRGKDEEAMRRKGKQKVKPNYDKNNFIA